MSSITLSNVIFSEHNGLPSGLAANKSSFDVSFDITWTGWPSGYLAAVGSYISLRQGTLSDSSILGYFEIKYSTTAISGTAHITGTIDLSTKQLPPAENYFFNYQPCIWNSTSSKIPYTPYGQYYFEIMAYQTPVISSFSATRCTNAGVDDDLGEYVKIDVDFIVNPLNDPSSGINYNTKALSIQYRESGTTDWSSEVLNISSLGYSGSILDVILANTFLASLNYEVRALLVDKITSITSTCVVPIGETTMDFDTINHRIAIGKQVEQGENVPQLDVAEDIRPGDILKTLKNFGLISADAVAYPRGNHSAGVMYLERWTEIGNSDSVNLEPWRLTIGTAYINGWKVKRAGWYQLNAVVFWDSATNARGALYVSGIISDNIASVTDTSNEAGVKAMSQRWIKNYVPAVTDSNTIVDGNGIFYLPADALVVVYALVSSTKTQSTDPNNGSFSIARIG